MSRLQCNPVRLMPHFVGDIANLLDIVALRRKLSQEERIGLRFLDGLLRG
jgi:hypothetical protein